LILVSYHLAIRHVPVTQAADTADRGTTGEPVVASRISAETPPPAIGADDAILIRNPSSPRSLTKQ